VVNIVSDGGDIGPLLVAHREVSMVSFTGSTATGKAVMASAAQQLKRVTLELGGNDAAVVLDDVDVAAVAPKIFRFAFFNSGQVCVSIKRIYVQAGVYDAMCDALAALAQKARVGDGLLPETEFGPLQNRRQYEATQGYLELAHRHGKVIAGGKAPEGPGFFVPPTVVRDIREGNPLVDEETFGPVRSVLRFDSVDEVLARVNATPYGLGSSVWSRDLARAEDIAGRIEAGIVWINQHLVAGPHVPIAGAKQSGIGVESGLDGLKELTRIHVVSRAKG
jgi:acyl-CoA reductase-like NAD-dependent aldehyde dehydrogenase